MQSYLSSLYYYNFVEKCLQNPLRGPYDRQKARQLIPLEQFNREIDQLLSEASSSASTSDLAKLEDFDRSDILLVKLLKYFKENLFEWVNALRCDQCQLECLNNGSSEPTEQESRWLVGTVELYRCPKCSQQFRFPRYNHPEKLMETKRGRCGEWAIAFAFICLSLDYDVRLVYITSDHVWVEVWSGSQQRWIHADPCENVLDNPLMYQCGWNKTIDLVIASGIDEVRDVTWRYTANWAATAADRSRKFSEQRLRTIFQQTNDRLQQQQPNQLTQIRRNLLLERWIGELVQFIRTPDQERIKPGEGAMKGRESGSLQWRMARSEIQGQRSTGSDPKFTFQIGYFDDDGKPLLTLLRNVCIVYDCCHDQYRHMTSTTKVNDPNQQQKPEVTEKVFTGWQHCLLHSRNIFRNLENDWKMCYISRCRSQSDSSSETGTVSWRFDLKPEITDQTKNRLSKIEICIRGQVFESGNIRLLLRYTTASSSSASEVSVVPEDSNHQPIEFKLNQFLIIDDHKIVDRLRSMELEAVLEGGLGNVSWQHSQLFRQSSLRTLATGGATGGSSNSNSNSNSFLPNSQFYVNFIYRSA